MSACEHRWVRAHESNWPVCYWIDECSRCGESVTYVAWGFAESGTR